MRNEKKEGFPTILLRLYFARPVGDISPMPTGVEMEAQRAKQYTKAIVTSTSSAPVDHTLLHQDYDSKVHVAIVTKMLLLVIGSLRTRRSTKKGNPKNSTLFLYVLGKAVIQLRLHFIPNNMLNRIPSRKIY
ncbi:hypothetical protein CHS0354_017057 [Potamilus streckersoni]|uniref:Uncharacterized protein n=1 Tax=Potamilus streckersoni TaxID=2493646 RepID=A0AAE0S779_9BIVA|nr:hypothetical protein CHS0354_017057 [Potamilus streckersoni]